MRAGVILGRQRWQKRQAGSAATLGWMVSCVAGQEEWRRQAGGGGSAAAAKMARRSSRHGGR